MALESQVTTALSEGDAVEFRALSAADILDQGDSVRVVGYAAVFNEIASIGSHFREVIRPGAFRAAIGRDDVVLLVNHKGLPLARTRSGTLKLEEDAKGLRIEASLDLEDPDARSVARKMRRGDLDKMSFGFRAKRQTWDDAQEPPLRALEEVELLDVSIVTDPAYDGASVALRSLDEARKEQRRKNFSAAAHRLRMKVSLDLRSRNR